MLLLVLALTEMILMLVVVFLRGGVRQGFGVAALFLLTHAAIIFGGLRIGSIYENAATILLLVWAFLTFLTPLLVAWVYDAAGRRVTGILEPKTLRKIDS